jgi:quinol monooxygenase YgiN
MTKAKKSDLVVVATAKSKPGSEAALLKALLDVAAPTRAQLGCVSFALYRSKEDASVITAFERWASKVDHERHHQGAHVATLMAAMGPVLAGPPSITVFEIMDEIDLP